MNASPQCSGLNTRVSVVAEPLCIMPANFGRSVRSSKPPFACGFAGIILGQLPFIHTSENLSHGLSCYGLHVLFLLFLKQNILGSGGSTSKSPKSQVPSPFCGMHRFGSVGFLFFGKRRARGSKSSAATWSRLGSIRLGIGGLGGWGVGVRCHGEQKVQLVTFWAGNVGQRSLCCLKQPPKRDPFDQLDHRRAMLIEPRLPLLSHPYHRVFPPRRSRVARASLLHDPSPQFTGLHS